MTGREAIGIIITERDLYCPKKRYEAFDKAISALREREERSKGCPSCNGGFGDNPYCGRLLKGAEE